MESTPEQTAEGAAIVKVLADVLERLVSSNSSLARQDPGQITKFHALKAPGIGILQYLERIHNYASCSNECFILALIYIDRLIQRNNFLLSELNVHRVIITAILLAAKFFDDAYYNNAYYSKVGGVLVSEMNGLEVDFLFRINFSLHVAPEIFEQYKAELVAHSISSAYTVPPTLPAIPQLDVPSLASAPIPAVPQSHAFTAPLSTMQASHVQLIPPQVTPSPSEVASNTWNTRRYFPGAPPTMDQQALYATEQQLLCNGLAQQRLLQRANSLPPCTSRSSSGCAYDNNPPYSAPMVSMVPVGVDDQYVLVHNRILPIQTTLVHHHHGMNDQVAFHVQTAGGPAHALSNGSFGSLLAGHY